jgi:hypothetical protein
MVRSLTLTAIALLWSIGVAAAQVAITPEMLPKVPKSKVGGSAPLHGGGATVNAQGNVVLGWNFFHATNCEWITDGVNNFLYVFPPEGGFWFVANDVLASQALLTGCVNGYFEAVNVINSSTGSFNAIFTYDFK